MAHSDDATKAWVSARPTKNSDNNVIAWECEYKYTLAVGTNKGNIPEGDGTMNDDYIHIFYKRVEIKTPSKAPSSYTKSELLTLCNVSFWNDMFNKKYDAHTASNATTTDTSFDVSTLSDS
jgi:hypothetical protein|tara:strand:+ start:155 stop:517 length:363 start_codon:yes stop_codon:yes gene_type:complete